MTSCQLVQLLQALLTPAVAALALVIGVAQWRTSHQRAVLDLFERRMAIYDALSGVIGEVVRDGHVSAQTPVAFARARQRVDLLFGPEVNAYLDSFDKVLMQHHVTTSRAEHGTADERSSALDAKHAAFLKIAAFFDDFPKLIKPYVKMHQKAPWF